MSTTVEAPRDGTELIAAFLPHSPFAALLGIEAVELTDDRAVLRLPWRADLATMGDLVHGGAIATLADCAVMAAAWCGAPLPEQLRGATVSMAIEFAAGARGEDVFAEGRLIRRGRSLCSVEVDVRGADGRTLGKAIASYKVG